jgi:exopolysaccharide biosynthesis glucuronosyltransferase PssE
VTFVTVGNATDGFRRLLDAVEALAGAGVLPTPLVIQSGHNPGFTSRHAVVVPFLSMDDFEDHLRRARLVIAHAGAGTVLQALAAGKTPVVMPRRARYGELVDDHQAELVDGLEKAGRVIAAWEPGDLPAAVQSALSRPRGVPAPTAGGLVRVVSACLEELLA